MASSMLQELSTRLPFFELSFEHLRSGGQLGFIVSSYAFAKRDFGKPLIENFFRTVPLQKVVDCSGLCSQVMGRQRVSYSARQCPLTAQFSPIRALLLFFPAGET